MDGIINIIKPPGMSSHQVVSFARKLLGMKRIGHTGTLDPGAGGLLTLCVGKATRLVNYMVAYDKTYIAELTLGISTTTQDASGETLDLNYSFEILPQQLADALASFQGPIEQIPPMASAIKIDGTKLYELHRKGFTVERKARSINIKAMHINKIWNEHDDVLAFGSRVLLYVKCSKGTYIRTLCHDIGAKLGAYGHMSFLARIASGPFTTENAYTLEELKEYTTHNDFSFIHPMQSALPTWEQIKVNPLVEQRIAHGNFITTQDLVDVPETLVVGDQVLIMDVAGELLALGEIRDQKSQLICQPTRVFMEG